MNLENTVCQRSQTQMSHTVWFHLYETFKLGKSTDTESITGFSGDGDGEIGSDC